MLLIIQLKSISKYCININPVTYPHKTRRDRKLKLRLSYEHGTTQWLSLQVCLLIHEFINIHDLQLLQTDQQIISLYIVHTCARWLRLCKQLISPKNTLKVYVHTHKNFHLRHPLKSLVLWYPMISLHSLCCRCDGAGLMQEKCSGSSCGGIPCCRSVIGTSPGGNRTESVNGYSGGLSAA